MNDNLSVDKAVLTATQDHLELEDEKTFLKLKTLLDDQQVPYKIMEVFIAVSLLNSMQLRRQVRKLL